MRPDEPLAASCAVLVNNKAFVNANGWPLGLLVSPQPPQSLPTPPIATPPPVWLAIVIDGAMADAPLAAAAAGLAQALQQLPPHTHVLVSVADRVASFFDLASPRPQAWVLARAGAPAGPDATTRALRASGVRPAPLAACAAGLQVALRALRRSGGGAAGAAASPHADAEGSSSSSADGSADGAGARGEAPPSAEDEEAELAALRARLGSAVAAIDLSLHLLGRGMAEWDARLKAELAAPAASPRRGGAAPQQPFPAKPMHAARVLYITAGGAARGGAAAAALSSLSSEPRLAGLYRETFDQLASKAAALDAQLDAIVGDARAPALPFLPAAAAACGGLLLHQPGLAAPLAANVAALAGRRLGWDAFIDVRTPAGLRVTQVAGPGLQPGAQLPAAISPVDPQPLGQPHADGDAAPPPGGAGRGAAPPPRVARPAVAAAKLSAAAVAAPAIDRGRYYGALLELTTNLEPGVAQEVQVLWEWTTADGRRVRQVSSTQLHVAERLQDFLSGLDLEAGALLTARRLVAAALAAPGAGANWGRPLKRGALADARLGVGLALQHVAQRMGVARRGRGGFLGFGGSAVWELPVALMPLAVAMYLLQAGPLLHAPGGDGAGAAAVAAADEWRLRAQQFLAAAPGVASCVASPALYVQLPAPDAPDGAGGGGSANGGAGPAGGGGGGGGGFQPAPPVTMAVGPQSLAVLDCGTEILVLAAAALALGGAPPPPPPPPPGGPQPPQPPQQPPPPDLPTAAAPAVQFAHQLARGRLPVPAIRVLQDARGAGAFMARLLPLHADVLPVQMALLPALRELSPHEHAELMEWHAGWGGAGAPPGGGFGHFCAACSLSLPVEGGLMECVVSDDE